jgi:hypothetical protein
MIMKKIKSRNNPANISGLMLIALITFFSVLSCPSPSGNNSDNTPPDVPGPDNKTYLKIENNTEYAVNVYINDPPLYETAPDTIRQALAGSSEQWELQPTAGGSNGETLYFEYLVPIGSGITVPYYANNTANIKIKKLEAGKINTQEVPPLTNVSTESIFVLIRNDTRDTIWMQQGNYTKNPYGSTVRDVPGGEAGVYVFDKSVTSLSGVTIGDLTRKQFSAMSLLPGRIYSFVYNEQNNPALLLVEQFDPNMAKNIWTMPTSTAAGRYFSVGLFVPRENAADGYILTGKSNYSLDATFEPRVGPISYLGMIAPNGDVTLEKRIILNSNIAALNLRSFIESNGKLTFAGQAYEEESDGFPFFSITDLNGEPDIFYNGFINDIDTERQALYGYKLVKNSAGYALGGVVSDYDTYTNQSYVAAVSVPAWDRAEHTKLWTSPVEDDVWFIDMVYDSDASTYIVIAQDNTVVDTYRSMLYFVGSNGTQQSRIVLDQYAVNRVFKVGSEYYIAGVYLSVSKQRGAIAKLNVSAGTVDPPQLVDSKYTGGAAAIFDMVLEDDGGIVLGGWCVEDISGQDYWWENSKPWLVKYDLTGSQKLWEEVYDYTGYYVYSVHHNAIGSYLLEVFNESTYESYLVSTDFLGRASGAALDVIPRGASFTAAAPGNPAISAEIIPVSDAALSSNTTLTIPKGQNGVISVSGTWASYQWYIDGSLVPAASAASYTFQTGSRNLGVYAVTVVAVNADGEKRSAACRVRVTG